MKTRLAILLIVLTALVLCFRERLEIVAGFVHHRFAERQTVAQRLAQFQAPVAKRLEPFFRQASVPYPPKYLTFLAFKDSYRLEIYAGDTTGKQHFVRSYPILGSSGLLGPKLREGDRQVPEGIYKLESLNPNSLYHLSLRLNYPNEFDRQQAAKDGRTKLGGDIMIHGSNVSIGCLAMGDEAAEELFVIAALTAIENISVIFSPTDFRKNPSIKVPPHAPTWTADLYEMIKSQLAHFEATQHELAEDSRPAAGLTSPQQTGR